MQSERKFAGHRILSLLLTMTLVIALLSPAKTVSAAAAPRFAKTSQSILVGDTYTMILKNKIAGASYIWSSTDKSVAKVNQKGAVTGLSKGSATIRCKINTKAKSYKLECSITVRQPADEVSISNRIDYLKIGDTYDLGRKLKPSKANEVTSWSSSDPSILSVDKKGVITARGLGLATITAATSKANDSITIYVVEQEKGEITKKDIVNGTITLSDKSFGDLSISANVGDVNIVLNNVTVGGTLQMESGASYTVVTNQCTINKVEAVNTLIKSFATSDGEEETATPSLVAGNGSIIVTIDSECNISVKQSNGAIIQSFSVTSSADGIIQISLEGFKGDLVIDSASTAAINIATTACEMNSATVKNATEGQQISLTDTNAGTEQASTIKAINMAANAALKVDVKAEEVVIAKEVSQAEVTISQPVTRLMNEGSQTSLMINSEVKSVTSTGEASAVSLGDSARVSSLRVEGAQTNVDLRSGAQITDVTTLADNTRVNLSEGASIQKVNAYGNSAAIEGTGKVNEAVITGNDARVNTEGTNVQVARGTTNVVVNGVEVKEEDKIAITTPTPTPKLTVTPTPRVSVTPRPTATPIPRVSAIPTVSPIPTTGPVVNPPYIPSEPGTSPTATPSPSPSPSPSPTPVPTEQEKLGVYKDLLADLHTATTKLINTQNTANYSTVKNSFVNLKNTLTTYEELDVLIPQVVISESTSLLYDYADYAELLIASGRDYGLVIRQYYENAATDSQTYEMAVAAANRLMHMVFRINTEGVMFKSDVAGVFTALTGSAAAFRTAMNKLLTDYEEFTPFDESDAAYYQKGIQDFVQNDTTMKAYYEAGTLTFFQAMNGFITLNSYYGVLKDGRTKTAQYQTLLNNFIDSLPTVSPVYSDGHYMGAEYDLTGKKEAVLTNIEAIMNSIDPATIWGEDDIILTLRGKYEELIIEDIIRKLYTTETYENGEYEMLNYYRLNRAELTTNPDAHVIREAIVAVVCCVKDVPEYHNGYLAKYEELTKNIISAAKADNAELVYTALLALYDAKLRDPEFADRWRDSYPEAEDGSSNVDKDYYLSFIQSKLQPGSDRDENGNPIDSMLYRYDQMGSADTAYDLSQAIYVLKSAVDECNGWLKSNYDITFDMLQALMNNANENKAAEVYAVLSDISDFMNTTYQEEYAFIIGLEKYAPIYCRLLREILFDENSNLRRYYDSNPQKDAYNRALGELCRDAIWDASWWLRDEEEQQQHLTKEFGNFDRWMPVMDQIYIFRYQESASEEEKLEALSSIFTLLGEDEEFVNNRLSHLPGLKNFEPVEEHLWDYWGALSLRIEDESMESNPETGETWYRSALHSYDLEIIRNELPDLNMLEHVCAELVESILNMENLLTLNKLIEAVRADNSEQAYEALVMLNRYFNNIRLREDSKVLEAAYAEVYMADLNNMLSDNADPNNWFYHYSQLDEGNLPQQLTFDNEALIDGAAHYVQGNVLTTEYYNIYLDRTTEVTNGTANLDAVIAAAYGSIEAFGAALDQLIGDADLRVYFGEQETSDFSLTEKYAFEVQQSVQYNLEHEHYDDGNISWLNYYNTNKASLGNKALFVIYQGLSSIIYITNDIIRNNETGLATYAHLVNALISGANAGDEATVLANLKSIYEAKMVENPGEWDQYGKPADIQGNSLINISYCIEQIKMSLQDEENYIHKYQDNLNPVFQDVQYVIYNLKDIVEISQLSGPAGWINQIDIMILTESTEEWKAAGGELYSKIISNPEFTNWFSANDQADLMIEESMISAYMQNIARHKFDETLYGEAPNQWFDSIHEYISRKEEGLLPYEGFLQRVGLDLMYSLIEVNRSLDMFHMVNYLYSEVQEDDISGTYNALAAINSYINTTNPEATGLLRGPEYSVAYYNVLKSRINGSDASDVYPTYLLLFNTNTEKTYSFSYYDTVMMIMYCTQWYTQGAGEPIITEEYNRYVSWSNIKQAIDTIFNDLSAENISLGVRLNNFVNNAVTEEAMNGAFTEEEISKLFVNEAFIVEIREYILGLIENEASTSGQYHNYILQGLYPPYDLIRDTCLELARILINYNN